MNWILRVMLMTTLFLASLASLADERKPVEKAEERIETLDQLMSTIERIRKETGTPAVGFALVDKDGPKWVGSFGQANIEKQVKADENTLYRIGSVSKMFVGLAVLKLVEEGKLHLDDRLHDLAPEIAYENPWEKAHPILLVHLLEHTTGWDDSHLAEYSYDAPPHLSLKEGLAYHPDSRKSRWVPGTRWAYCNTGPVVAAYIVEKITGMTFEEYVQRNFFAPLGMASTSYFETDLYKRRGATLYTGGKIEKYWNFYGRPAGMINSSPADMAKFLQLLVNRGSVGDTVFLQPASIDRMEAQAASLGAAQGITSGYGIYNYVSGYKDFGVAFHGHNGGLPGAVTELSYAPELGAGYIIMANTINPAFQKISDAVRSYLLRNTPKPAVPEKALPARFRRMDGYYRQINPRSEYVRMPNDFFGIMKFSTSGNRLHREPLLGGWPPSSDYAAGDNLLINPWSGLPSVAFVDDPLEGESVAAEAMLLKPVSPVRVFAQLGLIAMLAAFSIGSVLFSLVWIPRRIWGKLAGGATIRVRSWPLLASVVLFAAYLFPVLTGAGFTDLGRMSFMTVSLFLLSLAYPLLAFYSVLTVYKARNETMNRWVYWSSAILAALHMAYATVLAAYNLIGFRTWA